jgi:hypothetical protein
MRCPVDNELLVMADRNGVEIDYCPKCRGVWLDRGELDKIVERAMGAEVGRAAPAPAPAPVWQVEPGRAAPPPPAHAQAAPPYPAPPYPAPPYPPSYRRDDDDDDDDRYRRDGSYRKKKRDSFLKDLFDF